VGGAAARRAAVRNSPRPILDRFYAVGFENLSAADQIFVAVWVLDFEVCNGGFSQFFYNSSGEHADFATFALHAIGADQTRGLLERAIDAVGGIPSQMQSDREKLISNLPDYSRELLDDLDSEFYREPDNLNELLLSFISRVATKSA